MSGRRSFLLLLAGQTTSAFGSHLTAFALGVTLFQQTGSATVYALAMFARLTPPIVLAPFIGALIDRSGRRKAMFLGHAGAGLCTLAIAAIFWAGRLTPAPALLLIALGATFGAVQVPAFTAVTSLLIEPLHLARASGLAQLGAGASQMAAPMVAGALLARIGVPGILLIDAASFAAAVAVLAALRLPSPPGGAAQETGRGRGLGEASDGWTYIRARPGLFGLLLFFASINFGLSMVQVLIAPLVLGVAGPDMLGFVLSMGGLGMLLGSALILAWGGPRRLIHGVLGAGLLQGALLCCVAVVTSPRAIAAGAFGLMFAIPLMTASSQAIWQRKVAPDVQGRVFAIRAGVAYSSVPVASLLAGPLVDRLFEPLMAPGGLLSASMGRLLGVGVGRGAALQTLVLGALMMTTAAVAALSPRIRGVEDELPDQLGT